MLIPYSHPWRDLILFDQPCKSGMCRIFKPGMVKVYKFDAYWRSRKGVSLHRLVYEAYRGPIRPGDKVKFRDSDTENFDPRNLTVGHTTRPQMMWRNRGFKPNHQPL